MRLVVDLAPLVAGIAAITADVSARLPAELELGALEGALLIQGELMQSLPRGAGGIGGGAGLAGSISFDVERTAEGARAEVGSPLPYALHVEYGTKPHRPPVRPIQDWVEVKLGISGKAAEGAAWAIAAAIGKRGTRAQPVWEPVHARVQPQLQRLIDAAVARATGGGS